MPVKASTLWLTVVKRGLLSMVLLMAHSLVSTVTSCYLAIQKPVTRSGPLGSAFLH